VPFHGKDVSTFWSPALNKCVGPTDDNSFHPALKSQIVGGNGYCNGGIVIGSRFKATVKATLLEAPEVLEIANWSADGGASIDPATAASTTAIVNAPDAPGSFTVSVTGTTAHGCVTGTTRMFVAVSPGE
jgi:hypothetical protein